MQLPLQNFRKNAHKSLIHMEAASPKMRNRHFGVELGRPAFDLHGYPADLVASTAVVREMLMQFGTMLAMLAKKPGVTFINTQGSLPPVKGSWHNELHPSKSGFNQVADRFKAEIRLLFPGRVVG